MAAKNVHIVMYFYINSNGNWIDYTKSVTKLSAHLSNIEDSNFSVTLNSRFFNYDTDDFTDIERGVECKLQYGYNNTPDDMIDNLSPVYIGVIGDVNFQMGSQGTKYILKIKSKGHNTRNVTYNKVWTNKTASEIVKEIAAIHNLKPVVDDTTYVYEMLPQGNLSNRMLINKLRSHNIDYICYVISNELHFRKAKYGEKPLYTVNAKGGNLLELETVWQEVSEAKDADSLWKNEDGTFSTKKAVDSAGKVIETVSDVTKMILLDKDNAWSGILTKTVTNATKDTAAGADKKELSVKEQAYQTTDKVVNTVMSLGTAVTSQLDKTLMGTALGQQLKEKKRHELTCRITIVGVPYLENDKTIYLKGVPKRYEGVWYVEEVSHHFEEDFRTDLVLNKHGIKRLDTNFDKSGNGVSVGGKPTVPDAIPKETDPKKLEEYNQRMFRLNKYDEFDGVIINNKKE